MFKTAIKKGLLKPPKNFKKGTGLKSCLSLNGSEHFDSNHKGNKKVL